MTDWVKEVPPEPQAAQRFGNLAFRKYIALVEKVRSIMVAITSADSGVAYTRVLPGSIDSRSAHRPIAASPDRLERLRTSHEVGLRYGPRACFRTRPVVLCGLRLDRRRGQRR